MATEGDASDGTPLDEIMADIRSELVRRAAEADRDEHREIFDALEDE
ncbi:hypothetical protein [Halorientalis marina]|nr:hypothetical protein [Halorientalis marina]